MRDNRYDTLKGILIFLVVFAHMLITYDYLPLNNYNNIINGIYIFHMPLFFIISGYFSRNVKKENLLKYLLIFIFMNTSFFLYDYFHSGNINIFDIKYSSWFILLIFIYRLIVYNKKIVSILLKKYILFIIFILSILSGFYFKELIIVRLFLFFYFFIFGFQYKLKLDKKYCLILLVLSVAFIIETLFYFPSSLDLLMGSAYQLDLECVTRTVIFIADTGLFIAIIGLIPDKKIPVITTIGKNSIYIYIFHRIPTLILGHIFYPYKYYFIISIVISIIICLGLSILSKYLKQILETKVLVVMSIICLIIPLVLYNSNHELDMEMQNKLDNSISIGFVGDLILLEDQLKLSNNDFNYMFDNTRNYIQNTDYVFGVLEGPVDDSNEYSYGNFSDNKELRLNYPTSFLRAIENSGIDFVTISNNHIMDRDINSYYNTIDNLNKSKLDFIGTKDNYKIINIAGMKVGVLAYTYGLNYLKNNDYLEYTNFLTEPYSEDYEIIKNKIKNDFKKLRDSNVDLIIVMPHYGTQFSNKIDIYQEVWNRLFISEGADIILGDHAHVIEPIEYKNGTIIINSPGNYINSYIGHNSDMSMYVKIYIDKETHEIIGSSITPIVATQDSLGRYYPVLLEDTTKSNQERVLNLLDEVIFHNKIKDIKNTYYFLPGDSYKYDNKYKLELNSSDKKSLLYKKIEESNSICFIGDSITEGTLNGYSPWYIPLMSYFDKNVINISKGSYTSYDILNNFSDKIKNSNCDLSIINIGTNDIRYNKEDVNNYINNINKIIGLTNGEIIILAPWQTTNKDKKLIKDKEEKIKLYDIYNEELKKIKNVYYIDPNPYIKEVINYNGENSYILDGVHPNNNLGIKLYSFAVLRGL